MYNLQKIKLLFIPHVMPSHLFPLLVLFNKLDPEQFNSALLGSNEITESCKWWIKNLECLDIDRKMSDNLKPELRAISKFKPDVIIDDMNYFSAFSSRIMEIPRVSIVRKGILPFETYSNGYCHSSEVVEYLRGLKEIDYSALLDWRPESVYDLFKSDIHIIPSIPSVEVLPDKIKDKEKYIYSGPLLIPDYTNDIYKELDIFIKKNNDKRVVYFNVGLDPKETILNRVERCLRLLLNIPDIVIVTNIDLGKIMLDYDEDRCFFRKFLPMRYICSNADLMIHQCGSGAYNYQLDYKVPGIILGSKCYDRDEVAMQLESLGSAFFVSSDLPETEYFRKFNEHLVQLLDYSSSELAQQKQSLDKLKKEIDDIQKQFNFGRIIKELVGIKTKQENSAPKVMGKI